MKAKYVRLTPWSALNRSLTWLRSWTIRVISISWTWVSCAEVSKDSTIRSAMTWRIREAFSVVPRLDGSIEDSAALGTGRVAALGALAVGLAVCGWASRDSY